MCDYEYLVKYTVYIYMCLILFIFVSLVYYIKVAIVVTKFRVRAL